MWFLRVSIVALCVGAARCTWEESTVVPVRLEPDHSEPWRTLTAEEEQKVGEMRVYQLDAFGKQLILRLEPDQTFLAPGFVFHVVGSPESVPGPDSGSEPGCFFSGTVNGEARSAAALNLCSGLSGGFYFEGDEYFIQPLNSSKLDRVHSIRRRSRAAHEEEEGSSKCGVNEDEERMPKNLGAEASHGAPNADQTGTPARISHTITHFQQTLTPETRNFGVRRSKSVSRELDPCALLHSATF